MSQFCCEPTGKVGFPVSIFAAFNCSSCLAVLSSLIAFQTCLYLDLFVPFYSDLYALLGIRTEWTALIDHLMEGGGQLSSDSNLRCLRMAHFSNHGSSKKLACLKNGCESTENVHFSYQICLFGC